MTARILVAYLATNLIWILVAPLPAPKPRPAEHWSYRSCNLITQHCVIG